MYSNTRKLISFLLLLVCVTLSRPATCQAAEMNDPTEILQQWVHAARQQYENLPDQGKFATGAVVGYTTSKIAVRSAVRFVKIAGATFVATEVLDAAGIFEIEQFADSQSTENLKQRVLSKVGDIRQAIKRKLDGKQLKRMLESDRMGTIGAATGAFFGFLL